MLRVGGWLVLPVLLLTWIVEIYVVQHSVRVGREHVRKSVQEVGISDARVLALVFMVHFSILSLFFYVCVDVPVLFELHWSCRSN